MAAMLALSAVVWNCQEVFSPYPFARAEVIQPNAANITPVSTNGKRKVGGRVFIRVSHAGLDICDEARRNSTAHPLTYFLWVDEL